MVEGDRTLVRIKQAQSNLFLTLDKAQREITQQAYLPGNLQRWYLTFVPGDVYVIQSADTGEYISLPAGAKIGTKLTIESKLSGNYQKWFVTRPNNEGYVALNSVADKNLYIDNQNTRVPGTPMQLFKNETIPIVDLTQLFYFYVTDC